MTALDHRNNDIAAATNLSHRPCFSSNATRSEEIRKVRGLIVVLDDSMLNMSRGRQELSDFAAEFTVLRRADDHPGMGANPGSGEHRLFSSESDLHDSAGHTLVTSYAVLRPDGEWSLMVVNKDQENPHSVKIVFDDVKSGTKSHFAGLVNMVTFGSEQYQWRSDRNGGTADPDGPLARSTIPGGENGQFTLPRASVTVLRGKLMANPKP